MGDFVTEIAHAVDSLRPLLKATSTFWWEETHEKAFQKTKTVLVSPPVLTPFDPSLPTVLQTDTSHTKGIGFALLQKHGTLWRLVTCGSRFTTETEAQYSMIKLELSAIVWATQKCRIYLLGLLHYKVIVDHKPLVPILNQYTLDMVETPRIQHQKEKLQLYVFTTWRKGKDHAIPDALSRAPVSHLGPDDTLESTDMTAALQRKINSIMVSVQDGETHEKTGDPIVTEVRMAAQKDPKYQAIRREIEEGGPYHEFRQQGYYSIRDSLSTDGGLLLDGSRIVIPSLLRGEIVPPHITPGG